MENQINKSARANPATLFVSEIFIYFKYFVNVMISIIYFTFENWTCFPTVDCTSGSKLSEGNFEEKYWKSDKYNAYGKRNEKGT